MGDRMDREKARKEFQEFVTNNLASQARHVAPVANDPPIVETQIVNQSDVLKVFFELHPQHEKYRSDVDGVFSEQMFALSKKRWSETTNKQPTTKRD